ncbi:MAG: hypothetical protein WCG87_00860 [Bacteroidota bacterium]
MFSRLIINRVTLIALLLLSACSQRVCAQDQDDEEMHLRRRIHAHDKRDGNYPVVFLGASSGINNENGALGFNLDFPLAKKVSFSSGFGASTWGTKVFSEARYYLKNGYKGWAIGGGASYSTGNNSFKGRMQTVAGSRERVTLDLHPIPDLFLAFYKFWNIGKRYNRLFIDFGWSVPLENVTYRQISGPPLDSKGHDRLLLLSPGGLIVGGGISFGFYEKRH